MALWVFGWVVLPGGGTDPAMVVIAAWNVVPVAAWWLWARGAARGGHAARGPVLGVLLAIPLALLYPMMWTAASSDANGSLVYGFVPFWLLLVTGVAIVVAEISGGLAARSER